MDFLKLKSVYKLRLNRKLRKIKALKLELNELKNEEEKITQQINSFDSTIETLQKDVLGGMKFVSDINKVQDKIAFYSKKKNSFRIKLIRVDEKIKKLKKNIAFEVKLYIKIHIKNEKIFNIYG